jgi:hypothetical protein
MLNTRYSKEMLLFSVKSNEKNSTFYFRLIDNIKIILNSNNNNFIMFINIFLKKIPILIFDRLNEKDIDLFNFNNIFQPLFKSKIIKLISNDIECIIKLFREYINIYYQKFSYNNNYVDDIENNFKTFSEKMNNIKFKLNSIEKIND